MSINQRVQEVMKFKGINGVKLANLLNISSSAVSAWKNGGTISLQSISRIAELFPEINNHWLLTGEGSISNTSNLYNQDNIPLDTNAILLRLKYALNLSTDKALAAYLGIDPSTISTWKSRDKVDLKLIIDKCEPLDYNWLIKGDEGEETAKQTELNNNSKTTTQNEAYPVVTEAALSAFEGGESLTDLTMNEQKYLVPDFAGRGVTGMMKVSGSQMTPLYSPGDVIALRPVTDQSFFIWGKVYVVNTDHGALVNRIYPVEGDENLIECRSDNGAYPPFKLSRTSIKKVHVVVGLIHVE